MTPRTELLDIVSTGETRKYSFANKQEARKFNSKMHTAKGRLINRPEYEPYAAGLLVVEIMLEGKDVYVGDPEKMPQPEMTVTTL